MGESLFLCIMSQWSLVMTTLNLTIGWLAILAGLLSGATIGLFFFKDEWLGGYSSWRRRMIRLAHISMVGTGLLNIAYALSVPALSFKSPTPIAGMLFIAGAIAMPTVCLLSAWRIAWRHLFAIPVLCLVIATTDVVLKGLFP